MGFHLVLHRRVKHNPFSCDLFVHFLRECLMFHHPHTILTSSPKAFLQQFQVQFEVRNCGRMLAYIYLYVLHMYLSHVFRVAHVYICVSRPKASSPCIYTFVNAIYELIANVGLAHLVEACLLDGRSWVQTQT